MHNSHGQRSTCRKVGKEQTNPECSPGDLCLIRVQSISRRALGKGSYAIALVWVLLTWSSDTSENICQHDYTSIAISSQQELPRTKLPPPQALWPIYPKKDQGLLITSAKLQSAQLQSSASISDQLAAEEECGGIVHGLAPGIIKLG